MIRLAAEAAGAAFALWGVALAILAARARRKDGVSRQWINDLADRSRGRKAPTARTRGKYSRAGA